MRHPQLTEPAFRRLPGWLDGGVDSHGETYLDAATAHCLLRSAECASPDELADDTLNRVASTLEQSGKLPSHHPRATATWLRGSYFSRTPRASPRIQRGGGPTACDQSRDDGEADTSAIREQRLEYLDRCLNALDPAQRDLIVEYYRGIGREKIDRRRGLAARLGITMNALSSRASRIRDLLERCVAKCERLSSPDRREDA